MDIQIIQNKIYEIRGQRVMLDRDLAELYGVTTGNLNKAVKRNIERFPERFMFQLTEHEFLRFQNGISSWGGTRKLLYRTRRVDVIGGSSQSDSHTGKHFDYGCFCCHA